MEIFKRPSHISLANEHGSLKPVRIEDVVRLPDGRFAMTFDDGVCFEGFEDECASGDKRDKIDD